MLWIALLLLVLGVLLSAFFSGSETGFYRASRVRIVMDGMEGDRFSRQLVRLTNNPQLFVATSLVGNNIANYLTSLAVVLLAQQLFYGSNLAELIAPIAMAPVLFVYGELLPKNMFFQAPNRLLKLGAPLFILFSLLFGPISALLWAFGRILESLLGQSPEKVRSTLARKEVHQFISEGHDAGLLHETQRYLAQNFFIHASKRVAESCKPVTRFPLITEKTKPEQVLRIAKRNRMSDLPVRHSETREVLGFIRSAELLLDSSGSSIEPFIRELPQIKASELHGEALLKMQSERSNLAKAVNQDGDIIGLISLMSLSEPLLSGPLLTLRR